ncbi:hypothetical protein Tco_0115396 [Tanacetum coccineum]
MEEHRASMKAYKKVHNETVKSELRMAVVQQSMEMDMWEIKEKLAERREQMAIRAYEEDKRHEELNQKIKEDKRREELNQKIEELKNLIQSFIQNPISPPVATKVPTKPIQNSPCYDDLTYDRNKKTTKKGVGKEGFGCALNKRMEAKSFEEGLAEVTETLKRLQSTLLFHQYKLEESFRQARQDFSLVRQDFTLASEKFHISIKAAIKKEINQEGQVDFLGVQLNQRSPNRKADTPSSGFCILAHPESWANCTKRSQTPSSSTYLTSLLLADFTLQGKSKTNLGSRNHVAQDFKGTP